MIRHIFVGVLFISSSFSFAGDISMSVQCQADGPNTYLNGEPSTIKDIAVFWKSLPSVALWNYCCSAGKNGIRHAPGLGIE